MQKQKFAIYALKKFPPIFMGGLLMKIWGHINFEKKSQKREFSLGNIGETPKIENCLTQL